MAGRVVMLLIPLRIIPVRGLDVGARVRPLVGSLGRRVPGHCLSVLALVIGSIAAMASPVDRRRALLCRHRCQSSIDPVARHWTLGAHSTSGRAVRRIPSNHTLPLSNLARRQADSIRPDETRNSLMID